MATTLDELVNIKEVLLAFEFTPDGTCASYKAGLPCRPQRHRAGHQKNGPSNLSRLELDQARPRAQVPESPSWRLTSAKPLSIKCCSNLSGDA
jgi:hypothetical protein